MSSVVAQQKSSRGRIQKFLNIVETGGNKLPNPIIMFFYFTVITYVLSLVMAKLGVEVSYETLENGSIVEKTTGVVNLLSVEGIRNLFTKAIPNFTGHPALGTILIAMLGVGVAEKSGLIDAPYKEGSPGGSSSPCDTGGYLCRGNVQRGSRCRICGTYTPWGNYLHGIRKASPGGNGSSLCGSFRRIFS